MVKKNILFCGLTAAFLFAVTACSESGSDNMSASKTSYMLKLDKFYTEIGFEEGNTDTIRVEAPNTSWEVIDTVDWLTVTPSSGKGSKDIVIKVKENPSLEEYRSAVLEIHSTEKDFQSVHNYQVIQKNAEPYIIPDNTEINCGAEGTTVPITIKSNVEWFYHSSPWIEVNRTDNILNITVNGNVSDSRTGSVELVYHYPTYPYNDKTINEILVRQEKGTPIATPEKNEIVCEADKTTEWVSIEANFDWYTYCSASWIETVKEGNQLKIIVDNNFSTDREATIQLRYQSTVVSSINVKQKTANKEFTVTGNGKTVTFVMHRVKGGTFKMGYSPDNWWSENIHEVTLTNDYYIGETEVTQALWYAVMGRTQKDLIRKYRDSYEKDDYGLGDNYPVYWISYDDCKEFINKLNQLTGQSFRLPTEAEWEFAAKGGNYSQNYIYAGSNTVDNVAWHYGNSDDMLHIVKRKAANELGLYDMSGNVKEWCYDWYENFTSAAQVNPIGPPSGTFHVIRGGSAFDGSIWSKTAQRNSNGASINIFIERAKSYGLRLAL